MAQQSIAQPEAAAERRLAMTYEEFLAWSDEDVHAEWVDGEVIVFMPPKRIHQRLVLFLSNLVAQYARRFDLGEVLIAPFEMRILDGRVTREPDLLFVAREHAERLSDDRLDGPADLIIEIVSESSLTRDRVEKFYEYQEAGVPEYIFIDPRPGKERIDFFRLDQHGTYLPVAPDAAGRYPSAVLPGFWLQSDWLWQDPLPDVGALVENMTPQAQPGASRPSGSAREGDAGNTR